jgi:hypothetical protein
MREREHRCAVVGVEFVPIAKSVHHRLESGAVQRCRG